MQKSPHSPLIEHMFENTNLVKESDEWDIQEEWDKAKS